MYDSQTVLASSAEEHSPLVISGCPPPLAVQTKGPGPRFDRLTPYVTPSTSVRYFSPGSTSVHSTFTTYQTLAYVTAARETSRERSGGSRALRRTICAEGLPTPCGINDLRLRAGNLAATTSIPYKRANRQHTFDWCARLQPFCIFPEWVRGPSQNIARYYVRVLTP